MNGVAQLALHAGYAVSGSDRTENPELFQPLRNLGIEIYPQDGSGITEKTDAVIYSTAIEQDNPDLEKAKKLAVMPIHRAEMLAKLCEGKEVIAVAGTAGKSTVTGLLGHIFQCLPALSDADGGVERGMDPTVYCGAAVLNWKDNNLGNIRFGRSDLWIIETDESDRSFLSFHPDHAIITNIAEDHFELSELRKLFAQFESQVSGVTVKKPESFHAPTNLLGKHNTENINNALTLCKALGLDMQKCTDAVHTFKGVERRLERIGDKVIEDFAHSPVKIAAALEAVSGEFETFNTVWRPHGFTPLFQGLNGFIEVFSNHSALNKLNKVYILPVYYAGGTVDKKITSKQFVEKLQAAGVPAEFVEDLYPKKNKTGGGSASLEKRLLNDALPVLVMGARDPELPGFARRLASGLSKS